MYTGKGVQFNSINLCGIFFVCAIFNRFIVVPVENLQCACTRKINKQKTIYNILCTKFFSLHRTLFFNISFFVGKLEKIHKKSWKKNYLVEQQQKKKFYGKNCKVLPGESRWLFNFKVSGIWLGLLGLVLSIHWEGFLLIEFEVFIYWAMRRVRLNRWLMQLVTRDAWKFEI